MKIVVRDYKEKDWVEIRNLINLHWSENHPLVNKELFDWQYNGYGNTPKFKGFKILIINNKIEGFRGVIPGLYQYSYEGEEYVDKGVSFAVWLVTEQYRGKGFGYQLLKAVEDDYRICLAIGSNLETSVPIYKKNNYSSIDSFNRYVIPLDSEGYQKLQYQMSDIDEIQKWVNEIALDDQGVTPVTPDAQLLELLWVNSTKSVGLFSLYRSAEFWKWRYLDSAGFKYLFFGNPEETGIVVARIESVCEKSGYSQHNLKTLRIIEIIPYNNKVWNGDIDLKFVRLLKGVLYYAKNIGCVAADFHCSSKKFESILMLCGFKYQKDNMTPLICSLAGMFQPLSFNPSVNNMHWKIRNKEEIIIKMSSEDTYFVKSDNDRDRPVVWPVFEI